VAVEIKLRRCPAVEIKLGANETLARLDTAVIEIGEGDRLLQLEGAIGDEEDMGTMRLDVARSLIRDSQQITPQQITGGEGGNDILLVGVILCALDLVPPELGAGGLGAWGSGGPVPTQG
jgi:hypothetical protein